MTFRTHVTTLMADAGMPKKDAETVLESLLKQPSTVKLAKCLDDEVEEHATWFLVIAWCVIRQKALEFQPGAPYQEKLSTTRIY